MGVIVRKLSAAPSWVLRRARQFGAAVARAGAGVRRAVMDGYIVEARAKGASAIVTVVDMPFQIAMCQPYIYVTAEGEYNTTLWRRLDIPQGRDAVELAGYRPLTYASSVDADITGTNLLYIWSNSSLSVGEPPTGATFFARGAYNACDGAVAVAAVLDGAQQWIYVGRVNALQAMSRTDYPGTDPSSATIERTTNVTLASGDLGVQLRPAAGDTFTQYTIFPDATTMGVTGGVVAANYFTARPAPEDHQTPWRAGVVVASYNIDGAYPERVAAMTWAATIDTLSLPAPLHDGNVHMHRQSVDAYGHGLLVAQVICPTPYGASGSRLERVRGLVAAGISTDGLGATTVLEATVLFPGEPQAFASHPVLGVIGAAGPAVVCHRIRQLRDGEDVLRQDAADIGMAVVDAGGLHPVDLGAFIPVVYVKYNAAWVDGRISAGIWDFPVGPTGDWTAGLVQNACQCGDDELAVAVRPTAQFGAGATDIHIAVVRISTGEVLSVGPPVLRGSLWAFVSLTCWKRGVWAEGGEEAPAHLLLNLFREGGAPAEPEPIVRGTYRSHDSGRTTELVVNLGATLCYAMGSPLHRVPIGG